MDLALFTQVMEVSDDLEDDAYLAEQLGIPLDQLYVIGDDMEGSDYIHEIANDSNQWREITPIIYHCTLNGFPALVTNNHGYNNFFISKQYIEKL